MLSGWKPAGAMSHIKERPLCGVQVSAAAVPGRPQSDIRDPDLTAPKLPVGPVFVAASALPRLTISHPVLPRLAPGDLVKGPQGFEQLRVRKEERCALACERWGVH